MICQRCRCEYESNNPRRKYCDACVIMVPRDKSAACAWEYPRKEFLAWIRRPAHD